MWYAIATVPQHRTVLLYRMGDLYPVVGSYFGLDVHGDKRPCYHLEEGGPEDGEHRTYPRLKYNPTHWRPLPETPCPES